MLRIVALCETGTRALLGAVFGPVADCETVYAGQLLPLLDDSMLLLDDRGFDADGFLEKIAATRAQLLVRLNSRRTPARWAILPDGSYLTRINGVRLRVIDAQVTVTTSDGMRLGGQYRLATTLLDHRRYPAAELVALYHCPGNRPGPGHHRCGRPARPRPADLTWPDRRSCPGEPAPGTSATRRSPQGQMPHLPLREPARSAAPARHGTHHRNRHHHLPGTCCHTRRAARPHAAAPAHRPAPVMARQRDRPGPGPAPPPRTDGRAGPLDERRHPLQDSTRNLRTPSRLDRA
jgi:hypothetical protein